VSQLRPTFDRHDVLVVPVASETAIEVGRWEGRGGLATMDGMARLIPWPGVWNHAGQPAASVPAGLTQAGLPRAAMLVGRPNDEGTVLALAAQLEAERGSPGRRPPL